LSQTERVVSRLRRCRGFFAAFALAQLWAAPGVAQSAAEPAVIVVGGDRDYPPYEFLDREGKPAGFNVDLTRAIAEVMGLRVEFRLGGWAQMLEALREARIDALQGVSYSDQRAQRFELSPPHTIVNHAIFARKGTPPVSSLDELRGHVVAVHHSGIMDETLTERGFGDSLLRTDTPADALRLLASGSGEYAVVAAVPGTYIIRELKLTNLVPVARNVASHRCGYAVRKGNLVLLSRFTEGLAILKKTGRYGAINEQWLGVLEPTRVSWAVFFKYGAVVFVPLLLGLGGTVLWSRSLQRQVAQRTASLAREVGERQRAMEELRLNQAQLIQADKMAALGVLVSGVAHEINNPNGYILLNMPVLKDVYLDALEVFEQRFSERGDFILTPLFPAALSTNLRVGARQAARDARRAFRPIAISLRSAT
jgi:polar amino acid transport system substrate-binding protein